MTLTDIENLPASELKARREELIEELITAAADAATDDLARRYVQARTDAAVRDEKLAEQGKTIATLQEAFDQLKASAQGDQLTLEGTVAELQRSLAALTSQHDALAQQRINELAIATQAHNDLLDRFRAETARADRLKVEAERHLAALNSAASSMTAALTAVANALGQQAVQTADQGS